MGERSLSTPFRIKMMILLCIPGLTSVAACATERIAFEKLGVSPAERRQDENACLREAIGGETSGQLLAPYRIDRDTFIRCMEAHGYAAKPRRESTLSRPVPMSSMGLDGTAAPFPCSG
jgi:hypothetical protein